MSKKQQEEQKGGLPGWMATYGDLVTLLLCFFVLLFAMSTVDVEKFKAAMSSFADQIDIMPGGEALTGEELITNGVTQLDEVILSLENDQPTEEYEEDIKQNQVEELKDTAEIAKSIKNYLQEEGIETEVDLSYNSNYVKMTLPGEILFDIGKANIKDEAKGILGIIATMIIEENYDQYDIQIDGHTDNWDINTIQYPSNWYLSAARAIAVGDLFIDQYGLSPDQIACTGYGEFRAIADNDTPEGRARNRRVEIKIIVQTEEIASDDIYLNGQ